MCNCCNPTYLITTINSSADSVVLGFRTIPTLADGELIKFRLTEAISSTVVGGLPISVTVNVNGTPTQVPLWDGIGNILRSGEGLRTRTTYTAVFGSDPNHLQIVRVDGKSCCVV